VCLPQTYSRISTGVRGTVRDLAKSSWLTSLFRTHVSTGAFELALVPDFNAPAAFDDAVKGVSAIAHVAAVTSSDPDPNKVIPVTIAGVTNLLDAATKEPSVREFVITSSLVSATLPVPGNTTCVGRDTWNDIVLEMAWTPPPYESARGGIVYVVRFICNLDLLTRHTS
jgi:nucleoside-diphosphate-sugar epimerase